MTNKDSTLEKSKIAKLCHDLRGSLTVLSINLELFKESQTGEEPTAESEEFIKTLEKEIAKIKDLLDKAEEN